MAITREQADNLPSDHIIGMFPWAAYVGKELDHKTLEDFGRLPEEERLKWGQVDLLCTKSTIAAIPSGVWRLIERTHLLNAISLRESHKPECDCIDCQWVEMAICIRAWWAAQLHEKAVANIAKEASSGQ